MQSYFGKVTQLALCFRREKKINNSNFGWWSEYFSNCCLDTATAADSERPLPALLCVSRKLKVRETVRR